MIALARPGSLGNARTTMSKPSHDNLRIVFYGEDSRRSKIFVLSEMNTETLGRVILIRLENGIVLIDPEKHIWTFKTRPGKLESFTIGVGCRIPEGDALWGPAMIFDVSSESDRHQYKKFVEGLERGTLTR